MQYQNYYLRREKIRSKVGEDLKTSSRYAIRTTYPQGSWGNKD
jgi:hypothetical protein